MSAPPTRLPEAVDYSLRRYFLEAFEVVTNADSRFVRSFRAPPVRPGELTAAYFSPRRHEYLRPLPGDVSRAVALFQAPDAP